MFKVSHIYTVYIRFFWQENHQIIYGHIRCIYTDLANRTYVSHTEGSDSNENTYSTGNKRGHGIWVRSQAFMQSLSFQLARLCFDQAAARSKGVTIISPKSQIALKGLPRTVYGSKNGKVTLT